MTIVFFESYVDFQQILYLKLSESWILTVPHRYQFEPLTVLLPVSYTLPYPAFIVLAVSHPEEILGHRFQLGVLGDTVSPPKRFQGRALVRVEGTKPS